MNQLTPSPSDIDALLEFLPVFKSISFDPCVKSSNEAPVTSFAYVDAVERFFSLASKECWADHQYVPSQMSKVYSDDLTIQTSPLNTIRSLLTYCVRAERFCDGAWGAAVKSGKIVTILERLYEIRHSAD
jgi:hypothetical protein